MKIHTCEQGAPEWLQLRIGRVTASEMHNLLTPEMEIKKGEGPKTYLYSKLAEAWRGQILPGFTGSWATEQGEMREMDARQWYAFAYDERVKQVGFVESDDGRSGCSPDGLIGDDGGLEMKCPEPTNHVRYLVEGRLPKDYVAQVHGCLFVTGRPWWRFVSWRERFPAFVLTVERDEKIMATIAEALNGFYARFDAAFEQMNGVATQPKRNPMREAA